MIANRFNLQMSVIAKAVVSGIVSIQIVGCGASQSPDPTRTSVAGVVSFQGKPLPAGDISFESVDPPKATTISIGSDGTYASDRVPVGQCKVAVSTTSVRYGNPSAYVAIPEKYADTGTSGLVAEIKEGANENVNFDLKP